MLYTSPPCAEKIAYVESKVETINIVTTSQYRSRVTPTLGISSLNTDGNQIVSTANIPIKRLMKAINKITEREEIILSRWYSLALEENGTPQEYCPTPHILDTELLEFEMRKDLSELLFSKFNCSYTTAYELVGLNAKDEVDRLVTEKELGYDEIFLVHPTSYNSSGNSKDSGGRPSGPDDLQKQDYDTDYNKTRVKS